MIRLRVRLLEYELCDDFRQMFTSRWQSSTEVANPETGVFAPLSIALHQEWLSLGTQNEYVDPRTKMRIPLETAFAEGRVRLSATPHLLDEQGPLILIERESFGWHSVSVQHIVNSLTQQTFSLDEARLAGIVKEYANCFFIWDLRKHVWITAEEAVANQILLINSDKNKLAKGVKITQRRRKIFRLTAVRPGGVSNQWIHPLEALSYGLFNWNSGELAENWPARPLTMAPSISGAVSIKQSDEFKPSSWRSFTSALNSDWIRTVPEAQPELMSVIDFTNRRVIETSLNVVVNVDESIVPMKQHKVARLTTGTVTHIDRPVSPLNIWTLRPTEIYQETHFNG